jgi:hypothetical protein
MPNLEKKYVVAKSFYGLGGNLSVLSCAWMAARKLDRLLIIDWRGMNYGGDTDYFHKPSTEATVFPNYWSKFVRDIPQHQKGYNLCAANSDLLFDDKSGFSPQHHSIAVVARDGSFFHKPEYQLEIREFFLNLKPIDTIETKISSFVAKHFDNFMIGVHFRHGNGEPMVVPPDFDSFCRRIDELCSLAPVTNAPLFIATDCGAALDRFRSRYGDRIVSYPKTYPPCGTGGLHYQHSEIDKLNSAVEALIDIRLLSLCNSFVGSKSFFSSCANLWGHGFDKINSRWVAPRLRSFKPNLNQLSVSDDPDLMAVFGKGYPVDNLYFDGNNFELFFQDIPIGNKHSVVDSVDELERLKLKVYQHRLY